MKRIMIVAALLMIAMPVAAQTPDTLPSDRQLRQQARYARMHVDDLIERLQTLDARLATIEATLHARVIADSLAGLEPTPEPEPEPDPDPPVGDMPDLLDVDFDVYASTDDLLEGSGPWNRVEEVNTARISLDAAVAPPGHTRSMRYDYRHGGDGCGPQTIRRSLRFPHRVQEVWAEFQIRWSENFRTTNASCYPNDHKLIFGDTEADESGRWAFEVGSDTGPLHTIMVERPLGPGGFEGAYYLNRSNLRAADLWDDEWHTIRLYLRNSTTDSSGDGAMKVWIDGALVHDEYGFNTMQPGGGREYITGFSFAHNKDDGPPNELMHIWWGPIRAWSADPGW